VDYWQRLNKLPGNADGRRDFRQVVPGKPIGVGELHVVYCNLTTCVNRCETDHQGIRKRPGLTAEIADLSHGDAGLLPDLPLHTGFEVLARLNESGQHTVEGPPKSFVAGQQNTLAPSDGDNDSRRKPGIIDQTALRADQCPFVCLDFGALSTASTVSMDAMLI